jgi:hypothetical protein
MRPTLCPVCCPQESEGEDAETSRVVLEALVVLEVLH